MSDAWCGGQGIAGVAGTGVIGSNSKYKCCLVFSNFPSVFKRYDTFLQSSVRGIWTGILFLMCQQHAEFIRISQLF